jgi:WhiB family redox-sensing transcriptional regulator
MSELPRSSTGSFGWMLLGACLGQDPELFFPIAAAGPAQQQITAAKAVCGRCAVRLTCLSYALSSALGGSSALDGIWGGTTREERHAMRSGTHGAGRPAARPSLQC